jgi:GT2 family glycosyltransferase
MDLSVIIVCYKGWEGLSKCLEALDAFNTRSFSMEVIVVDNNSGDGTINDFEKRFGRFRFIKSRINGGYAYGCNLGAAKALGDVFMILNPDTIVREEEAGKLLEITKSNPEYFVISCRQVREDGKDCRATGKFPGFYFRDKLPGKPGEDISFPDWVSGSLMMFRREVFIDLKGFDEEFWMYYEDVDICLRARNAGGKIAFFNNIVIEHKHGGSSRADLRTTSVTKCEVQASRHLYVHKHFIGFKRIILQVFITADNMITGILAGVFGLIFFFIPKLFVRLLIFLKLINYYTGALLRGSWISPRSVIYSKAPSE